MSRLSRSFLVDDNAQRLLKGLKHKGALGRLATLNNSNELRSYLNGLTMRDGSPMYITKRLLTMVSDNFRESVQKILDYVMGDIIGLAENRARDEHDYTVYAEDIIVVVMGDDELSELLLLEPFRGMSSIPLVIIDSEGVPHPVPMHLYNLNGVEAFNRVLGYPFRILFEGIDITYRGNRPLRLDPEERADEYVVTIAGEQYGINRLFLQGFASAAKWLGVDHHPYWSNLYAPDQPLVKLTF